MSNASIMRDGNSFKQVLLNRDRDRGAREQFQRERYQSCGKGYESKGTSQREYESKGIRVKGNTSQRVRVKGYEGRQ